MKNQAFKFFYKLHIYLGLFVAVHFIVLALSGSVLLFKDEFESLTSSAPTTNQMTSENHAMSMGTLMTQVVAQYPGERPLAVFADEGHEGIWNVRLGINDAKEFRGARKLSFDAATGNSFDLEGQKSSFMEWMLNLHREFFMGSWGKIYVGIIGLLYVFVMISGFVIYGKFGKKLSFGEIRYKSPRHLLSDLHRFVGMVVFAWGLIIGTTGFFLGISSTLIKVYQYQELKELNAQYAGQQVTHSAQSLAAVLDQVIATAQKALPQAKLDYIAFPDTQFSPPNHFLVLMVGTTPMTEKLNQLVVVDAATGLQSEVRELPWYLKIALISEPLHFGNYGGLFLKVSWLGFSLLSLLLPIFGLMIYWKRKRQRASTVAASTATLSIGKSSLMKSSYAVPILVLVAISVLIVSAFVVGGGFAKVVGVALFVPVLIARLVVWKSWKGRS